MLYLAKSMILFYTHVPSHEVSCWIALNNILCLLTSFSWGKKKQNKKIFPCYHIPSQSDFIRTGVKCKITGVKTHTHTHTNESTCHVQKKLRFHLSFLWMLRLVGCCRSCFTGKRRRRMLQRDMIYESILRILFQSVLPSAPKKPSGKSKALSRLLSETSRCSKCVR